MIVFLWICLFFFKDVVFLSPYWIVSKQNSAVTSSLILLNILRYRVSCFFLTAFKIFSMFLVLSNSVVMFLSVIFFMLLVLGICCTFWTYELTVFFKFSII